MSLRSVLLCVIVATLASAAAWAQEWPKWRGAQGDGIVREKGLAMDWPEAGPAKLWTTKVGEGYSTPVAFDGRLYIVTLDGDKESLTALDAAKGDVLWQQSYTGGWTGDHPGSRASPTIEGQFIYTYGGSGDLFCRKLADGEEVWHINLLKELGCENLEWGVSSQPVIDGDRIYLQGGTGGPLAVAVDKKTGKIVWRTQDTGLASYSPIVLARVGQPATAAAATQPAAGGFTQVIVFAGKALCGVDPVSGKTIWSIPRVSQYNLNIATPIVRGDKLFVATAYNLGCMQVRLRADGADEVYHNTDLLAEMPSPILDGDYLYANNWGTLICMKWADGRLAWKADDGKLKLGFGGTLVRFADRLIAYSQEGQLSLVKATPEGWSILRQVQEFEGEELWASPLVYKGRLYVKGTKDLVCLDIAAK